MKIAVLGAGMVGRTIAADLANYYEVTAFDVNEENLNQLEHITNLRRQVADLLLYEQYESLLRDFDLVVNAVPGFMGYRSLAELVRLKKDVADISFFPENAMQLDALAKENNVTVITDCGVAPGMSNLILGFHNEMMSINSFECMVGGLPLERKKPFEYKAPFSPIDVIEEYTRPARYVENGHIVTKPALSDPEYVDFDKIGTLESFNTDGLRSILFTMSHIMHMKEKTLRYPGHIELIKALMAAGFFDETPRKVKGAVIRPLDLTTELLFEQWKPAPGAREFTVMRIILKGKVGAEEKTIEYNLYDEYDSASNTPSMSRTTGYTCNAMVHMIAEKNFREKGVFPPELVGRHARCFDFVMKYLQERNVIYNKREY